MWNSSRKQERRKIRQEIQQEIRNSKTRGGYLPRSNPYSVAPLWCPYPLARLLHWMMSSADDERAGRKRKSRRK